MISLQFQRLARGVLTPLCTPTLYSEPQKQVFTDCSFVFSTYLHIPSPPTHTDGSLSKGIRGNQLILTIEQAAERDLISLEGKTFECSKGRGGCYYHW